MLRDGTQIKQMERINADLVATILSVCHPDEGRVLRISLLLSRKVGGLLLVYTLHP